MSILNSWIGEQSEVLKKIINSEIGDLFFRKEPKVYTLSSISGISVKDIIEGLIGNKLQIYIFQNVNQDDDKFIFQVSAFKQSGKYHVNFKLNNESGTKVYTELDTMLNGLTHTLVEVFSYVEFELLSIQSQPNHGDNKFNYTDGYLYINTSAKKLPTFDFSDDIKLLCIDKINAVYDTININTDKIVFDIETVRNNDITPIINEVFAVCENEIDGNTEYTINIFEELKSLINVDRKCYNFNLIHSIIIKLLHFNYNFFTHRNQKEIINALYGLRFVDSKGYIYISVTDGEDGRYITKDDFNSIIDGISRIINERLESINERNIVKYGLQP